MSPVAQALIPHVVSQHLEEAVGLRTTRTYLLSAPHVTLSQLGRWDERLASHLSGIVIAGEVGRKLADAALEMPGSGEVFVAAVGAIYAEDSTGLDNLFALAEAAPDAQEGLTSAFGWVSAQNLKGIGSALLRSTAPLRQRVGIIACALHRVDAGPALAIAISSTDAALRARSLRLAGETGRRDQLRACIDHLDDEDTACAFWAAWSAALSGDRGAAVKSLTSLCLTPGEHQMRALQLVLKILSNGDALSLLKTLARDPAHHRALLQGAGIAGDPYYIPWLINQMSDPKAARLAGESLSFITGLNVVHEGLERKPPENAELGPTESPEDEDVAMDPDDNLPWPHPDRIQKWWEANKARFENNVRYFMGEPVKIENCKRVLREGYQRQRIAAALHLALLQPGTTLFPTSAPAWRQKRWLAKME
jgi:uncharacterized protein (TIGR02270 family)